MVQIALIRPGSTEYDEQGRILGTLDVPLSPRGQADAERLAEQLRGKELVAIYSSPCQSAWETATLLATALDVKLKKLDSMQNLDLGLWQGTLVDEVKRKQPTVYRQWQEHPENMCPPEGEMLAQAQERIETALAKLLKKHREGTIGLVVPEPLASLVRSQLALCELRDLWKGAGACGSWECIPVEPSPATASRL